jgi:quinol monooxygenase YgiN
VKVVLRLIAKPDKVEDLRSVVMGLVGPTRKETGCISYEVLQNAADLCDFTLIEEWTSGAALDAHLTTQHVQDAFAKGMPLLAKEPDNRRYTTIG